MTNLTLSAQEKKAYELISKSQRRIATITAEEISVELGYATRKSGHDLIKALEAKGLVQRLKRGQLEVL